jgi:AcrR family transcriptional regulator
LIATVVEMPGKVKPSRRRYHSPLRADQAEQTRRRILEAAYRLFVDRGYAGTTIAAVAKEAGVSPETIYLTLGSKRGLLEGVIELAIAGEDDPPTQEDPWWASVAHLPSASERLEKMVEYSCRILARTRPIHAVIRGAADKEAFAAALGRRLLHDRATNQTERIRQHLGDHLREGLSVSEAGQRYCALTSPELYYLVTVEFGWTAEQHRKWLTDLLETELLGPPLSGLGSPPPGSATRSARETSPGTVAPNPSRSSRAAGLGSP